MTIFSLVAYGSKQHKALVLDLVTVRYWEKENVNNDCNNIRIAQKDNIFLILFHLAGKAFIKTCDPKSCYAVVISLCILSKGI